MKLCRVTPVISLDGASLPRYNTYLEPDSERFVWKESGVFQDVVPGGAFMPIESLASGGGAGRSVGSVAGATELSKDDHPGERRRLERRMWFCDSMMRRRILGSLSATVCCATAVWGCTGSSGVSGTIDVVDSVYQEERVTPEEIRQDKQTEDLRETWDYFDFGVEDQESECPPGTKCFLDPCATGKECHSGYCLMHMGDQVCSKSCIEECPDGFKCTEMAAGGPDVVFVCKSLFPALCLPCKSDSECKAIAGLGSACIEYGNAGFFCASPCLSDSNCPPGFECEQRGTVEGLLTTQCVLESGSCGCTNWAVQSVASTLCFNANSAGKCAGERVCTAQGLSDCDAPVPEQEVCDGVDNNCDGVVDDVSCDDGNVCTTDSCKGADGCVNKPATGGECVDGNACTVGDHCEEGECVGTPLTCDDKNPCTKDSCDTKLGCQFEFTNDPCDDGDPCTISDTCFGGKCVGLPGACGCMKDSDCSDIAGGNLCLGTWYCNKEKMPYSCVKNPGSEIVCKPSEGIHKSCYENSCNPKTAKCETVNINEGGDCSDANKCTVGDECKAGKCQPGAALDCGDGKECTQDSCQADIGCVYTKLTGTPCSDGDVCTAGDSCSDGICEPGSPLKCDDSNACTADSCEPQKGCVHTPVPGTCDDGNECTTDDTCKNGWCVGSGTLKCDDGNPCTTESCDPQKGCIFQINNAPCDDGNQCTVGEQCSQGACQGGTVLSCNDQNPCTKDSCNPKTGCVYEPTQAPCSDSNECTLDDKCVNGVCVGTSSLDCDDSNPCTKDSCVMSKGCVYTPVSGPCSDGNVCTLGDFCSNGQCISNQNLLCDDGNVCTIDSCDSEKGCIFTPIDVACDDSNACTVGDKCEAGICKPGSTLSCKDNDECTSDSCDPSVGCVFAPISPCCGNGAVETGEQCDDGNKVNGDGCTADCKYELKPCSNGSLIDCNVGGTTLIPSSAFLDPLPPAGWVQCAGFVNTTGDDVAHNFLNNCLNTTRLRIRVWNTANGQLEEDVYSENINVGGSWPSFSYLGGTITKVKTTYWTGVTTYYTTVKGGDACSPGCCVAAPDNTITLGTGNSGSALIAAGNVDGLEWRVNCGGPALPGRQVALYR